MPLQRLKNSNHPKAGSTTKVEPIRDLEKIRAVKEMLSENPRDLYLFTLGINTAYRANELLSITVGQVAHLKAGDSLDLKQSKNGRYRTTTLNQMAVSSIQNWLEHHPPQGRQSPVHIAAHAQSADGFAVH